MHSPSWRFPVSIKAQNLQKVFKAILLIVSQVAVAGFAASTPAPPSKPIPPAYFGLHAQRIVVPPRMEAQGMKAAPFPTIPFKSFRMWSIPDWAQINGSPGQQYQWVAIDRFLAMTEDHGVNVMYTIGHTPRWASSYPDDRDCPP